MTKTNQPTAATGASNDLRTHYAAPTLSLLFVESTTDAKLGDGNDGTVSPTSG